ncbi:hypothetical protein [Lactococcus lactis]|uniref:hypothetical protein n=1 Tax=Lactococcus lactis TaxID=1358 RepID=UPI002025EB3F|nr:hypothetical protein [Lactococcus lactis]MCL9640835.1 hypothetical protein [Lactococcus lactis]
MKNYQENPISQLMFTLLRLIVILLSMQGVVIATSLISQGIILPIMNYIGDTLPIASLVIRDLIYIYLVLGMIAFLVLSLVFSNIKRNFISAYSLKFYKNMIIKLAEKQK